MTLPNHKVMFSKERTNVVQIGNDTFVIPLFLTCPPSSSSLSLYLVLNHLISPALFLISPTVWDVKLMFFRSTGLRKKSVRVCFLKGGKREVYVCVFMCYFRCPLFFIPYGRQVLLGYLLVLMVIIKAITTWIWP